MGVEQNESEIPERLLEPSAAALRWLNESQQTQFELTGVVDYEAALEQGLDKPFEVGLVLCDGEICKREQVRITPIGEDYAFSLGAEVQRDIPSLLDPPPGVRSSWLDKQLASYEFVVLLFYRGLW